MPLITKLKERAWFFLNRNRRNPAIARFSTFCKNVHRATWHATHEAAVNGERAALQRLASGTEPVLFDVGANIGIWTAMALELFPKATVYAFEPDPGIAPKLAARFASNSQVKVNSVGLSDVTGEAEFFSFSGAESVLSSLRLPIASHAPFSRCKTQVVRGDEFCRAHGIDQINFLKIDAEHTDFEVLQGFSAMLQKGKIDCVQFEHQRGRFLKDFYDYLEGMGFSVGKLYSNYIEFGKYDLEMEDFLGPNYVALPARRADVIQKMIRGW